jgi:hypothetical protein
MAVLRLLISPSLSLQCCINIVQRVAILVEHIPAAAAASPSMIPRAMFRASACVRHVYV